MSSLKDYDGECGIIPSFAHSGLQIRCNYELGHHGPCSFEKHRRRTWFYAGCFAAPTSPEEHFLNSVLSHSIFDHNVILIDEDGKFEIKK